MIVFHDRYRFYENNVMLMTVVVALNIMIYDCKTRVEDKSVIIQLNT